ncbi:MAG: hypothetical protein WCJ30_03320 [Deltaproteobacteria bacterium]
MNVRKSGLAIVAFVSLASGGCAPQEFHLESNGNAQSFVSVHSTHATQGSSRVLEVCGEYPTVLFASDTGGTVCVHVELDAAAIGAIGRPATLTVSGTSSRAVSSGGAVTFAFGPGATNAPALTAIHMAYNCFCPNPPTQLFTGTITLESVERSRIAGTTDLTVAESGDGRTSTAVVRARFDASGS